MKKVYIAPGHGRRANGTLDNGASGGGTNEQEAGDAAARAVERRLLERYEGVEVRRQPRGGPNFSGTRNEIDDYGPDVALELHHDWIRAPRGGFGFHQGGVRKQICDALRSAYVAEGLPTRAHMSTLPGTNSEPGLYTAKTKAVVLWEIDRIGSYTPKHAVAMADGLAAFLGLKVKGATPAPPPPSSAAVRAGVVRHGRLWLLRNSLSGGGAEHEFWFGVEGDIPLVGDWNGDGQRTPGVFRGGRWFLRNAVRGGEADVDFWFGQAGDVPIVGDWNGDGRDTIGVQRGRDFFLKNRLRGGDADLVFKYGEHGDVPLVGDWDGDGAVGIGVRRGSMFLLRNALSGGNADEVFHFGHSEDTPLVGDWLGAGRDFVGVRRGGLWLLRTSHRGGDADLAFHYGRSGDLPIVW